jgi:hypothetical protein
MLSSANNSLRVSRPRKGKPLRSQGFGLVALCIVFAATATSGCAVRAGAGGSTQTALADCDRSIEGDVKTARKHLEKGRAKTAFRYIQSIQNCPGALDSLPYLETAMEALWALAELNKAWSVGQLALRQAAVQQDTEAERRITEWQTQFRAGLVLVVVEAGRGFPAVSYSGPFVDENTQRQLEALRARKGVILEPGTMGYWLVPGTYMIGEHVKQWVAGETVRAAGAEGDKER